jgi:hypothetical protein
LRELPVGSLIDSIDSIDSTDSTDFTDSSVRESLRASVDAIEIWFKPRRRLAASQRGVFPKTKRVRTEMESFMVGADCLQVFEVMLLCEKTEIVR